MRSRLRSCPGDGSAYRRGADDQFDFALATRESRIRDANLLTLQVQLPKRAVHAAGARRDMERATPQVAAFYQQLLEKTAALPGVESVASMTGLPTHFAEGIASRFWGIPRRTRPKAASGFTQASQNVFRTLKIST